MGTDSYHEGVSLGVVGRLFRAAAAEDLPDIRGVLVGHQNGFHYLMTPPPLAPLFLPSSSSSSLEGCTFTRLPPVCRLCWGVSFEAVSRSGGAIRRLRESGSIARARIQQTDADPG
eukprot:GHVU01232147.1.p4 GENE.GHVU01232147.1~~GHVU01232147.1.p4  ORF type:complete len:116 (-),score=15.72 GHVU01232147.1:152-499(-)